jgi:creatinine amidohydrolase/Fe(II)-dependent formamide hydrolase-like protein
MAERPEGQADALYFAHLSYSQLEARLRGERKLVLLFPVGATEAHGPHSPLSTDVIISEEFKKSECHAGRYETSLVLADHPEMVDAALMSALPEVPISLVKVIGIGSWRKWCIWGMRHGIKESLDADTPT